MQYLCGPPVEDLRSIWILHNIFLSVILACLISRDRGRERHKGGSSKDSTRSERSVVINPPDTPSNESPVQNEEPLPGEPSANADPGDEAQVSALIPHFLRSVSRIKLKLKKHSNTKRSGIYFFNYETCALKMSPL